MAHHSRSNYALDNVLLPAMLLSLGLHIVAAAMLNPFQFDTEKKTPPLEIVLQPPKPVPPPPPPPEPEPEPPKPEPPKPLPKKVIPPPVKTPPPPQERAVVPPPVAPPPPPQVIAAAPEKVAEPTFVAPPPPPPEPEKPREPPPDIDADLGKYGSVLAREFAKHKQYPRIAQMRGWQGTVRVKLEVDASGAVTSSTISESSGHEALDKQALEMVKKASPLPSPPETLRGRPFTVTVPVLFRLE